MPRNTRPHLSHCSQAEPARNPHRWEQTSLIAGIGVILPSVHTGGNGMQKCEPSKTARSSALSVRQAASCLFANFPSLIFPFTVFTSLKATLSERSRCCSTPRASWRPSLSSAQLAPERLGLISNPSEPSYQHRCIAQISHAQIERACASHVRHLPVLLEPKRREGDCSTSDRILARWSR